MITEDFNEYINYLITIYDEYLMKTEKRGISYGEIGYIANLNKKGLKDLENEIIKELNNGSNNMD